MKPQKLINSSFKNTLLKIKHNLIDFISLVAKSLRPLLGVSNVCIYQVSCGKYAKNTLKTKFFPFALILIILRVLSCNPLTALILKLKSKK
jgi:putative component of membrane protein insertase Oxa1/YidC/SpoIIIJ protein YidD